MAVQDGKALSDALSAADGQLDRVPALFNDLQYRTDKSYQHLEAVMTEILFTPFTLFLRDLCLRLFRVLFG